MPPNGHRFLMHAQPRVAPCTGQGELAKAQQAGGDPKAALRQRLEQLVKQQPVMLFMKVGAR